MNTQLKTEPDLFISVVLAKSGRANGTTTMLNCIAREEY